MPQQLLQYWLQYFLHSPLLWYLQHEASQIPLPINNIWAHFSLWTFTYNFFSYLSIYLSTSQSTDISPSLHLVISSIVVISNNSILHTWPLYRHYFSSIYLPITMHASIYPSIYTYIQRLHPPSLIFCFTSLSIYLSVNQSIIQSISTTKIYLLPLQLSGRLLCLWCSRQD